MINFKEIEELGELMRDRELYPAIIEDNAGLGYNDGKYFSRPKYGDQPRKVFIEITSFVGISWNAEHFYGKLNAEGVSFSPVGHPNTIVAGFGVPEPSPLHTSSYEIELLRPLTKEEIEEDEDRWKYYEEGTPVNAWNNKADIIALGIECFKRRFQGSWELWINDHTTSNGQRKIDLGQEGGQENGQ